MTTACGGRGPRPAGRSFRDPRRRSRVWRDRTRGDGARFSGPPRGAAMVAGRRSSRRTWPGGAGLASALRAAELQSEGLCRASAVQGPFSPDSNARRFSSLGALQSTGAGSSISCGYPLRMMPQPWWSPGAHPRLHRVQRGSLLRHQRQARLPLRGHRGGRLVAILWMPGGHAQDVTAGRYVRLGSPMLLYDVRVSFKL